MAATDTRPTLSHVNPDVMSKPPPSLDERDADESSVNAASVASRSRAHQLQSPDGLLTGPQSGGGVRGGVRASGADQARNGFEQGVRRPGRDHAGKRESCP